MSIENNAKEAADQARDGAADVKSQSQNAAENIKDKVGNAIDNIKEKVSSGGQKVKENAENAKANIDTPTVPSKVIGSDNNEDKAKNADAEAKAKVYNLK
jgi:hypothetical protein